MATTPYKRNGGAYASIATLVNQSPPTDDTGGYSAENSGQIVINFPCMPESIELARQANYSTAPGMAIPDGFHVYHHTDPLRIPIKFSLSARDDDYCRQDGPYALLALAARLHALVMPISNAAATNATKTSTAGTPATSSATPQLGANSVAAGSSGQSYSIAADSLSNVFFPPACILAIMMASSMPGGASALGINCRGFVERVNVSFRGPWLQGSLAETSGLRNLPSYADYEFTFVHQPGYTNNIAALGTNVVFPTTNAKNIFDRFYKEGAPSNPNITYADLNSTVIPATPAAATRTIPATGTALPSPAPG